MNHEQLPTYRHTKAYTGQIDVDNKIIYNVIMAKVGEAKGHGEHIEQSFIDDMVKFANRKMKEGVKAHFDHNYSKMGKQLGRFKNIRVEGDAAVGDLHLYESANDSPTNPGMADWLIKLAQEDKKAVMSSIVFVRDHYYQYDDKGKKHKVWYYDEKKGWISANSSMPTYVAFAELRACDIVEEGAVTESLFDANATLIQFNDIINHPDFRPILEANYTSFTLLNDFYAKQNKGLFNQIKSFFMTNDKGTTDTTEQTQETNTVPAEQTELKTTINNLEKEVIELKKDKALQAQRIGELMQKPAAEHTDGEKEDQTDEDTKSFMNSPINQKFKAIRESIKNNQK